MIEVKNLCAGYGGADVIHNISFKAQKGESLCILGPNGSGKSTLLRCIARIIDYRGTVLLEGRNVAEIPRKEFAKKAALLSQSVQVFFPYTVYETVSMGRYAYSQGFLKTLSAEDREIIEDILNKLDIWDIKERMIDELSGGTLQRVFLARTLAQTPDFILLDEPANHLDLKHQIELLDFIKTWISEKNKTLISVFHDLTMARRFSDSAVVLDNGKIAANGKIEEVLNSEILDSVYGMDIRSFFRKSLELLIN
ncbi:MAG: ABC transporter ATP-binding protein [Treponema sp.]|nr:ABC transporter ATP-binding protein [Treponema sp.]